MTTFGNQLEIHCLQNLTTEFELVKNLQKKPLEVIEVDDRVLAFNAPSKICGLGLIVHMEGFLYFSGKKIEFLATGRVTSSQDLDNHNSKYTVELHRFDKGLWEEFRKAMVSTQVYVDKLFNSMKESE
ncbi:MAG: hypothetical protein ACKOX6_08645 [Bdellovibrio sp.]